MINKKVMFQGPWQVETVRENFAAQIGGEEVLVKKLYTLISPGTELAILSGNGALFRMPDVPGMRLSVRSWKWERV